MHFDVKISKKEAVGQKNITSFIFKRGLVNKLVSYAKRSTNKAFCPNAKGKRKNP